MKILYGVSGEGFGHSSRALVFGNYLKKKGHIVKIVTYGQAYKILKNKFDVFRVRGLHLYFIRGSLDMKKTAFVNSKNFSKNLGRFKKFHKLMNDFNPDLCISDMEPIVPILSFWYNRPLISFDNQHRITNLEIDVPKKYYKDYLFAKTVVNRFVSKADCFIVTSFANAKIKKKNTFIVSPIIREEVRRLKPKDGGKILVYLTKKDRSVINLLKKVDGKFVVYGYNVNKQDNNLEFKKRAEFLEDLKNCKAIIASSGFTLMSEALYLRKPYLALPLGGQFEQVLNSLFLKQAGFGDYSEKLTKEEVEEFFRNIPKYKKNLRKYRIDFDKLFNIFDKVLKNYN